MVGGEDIVVVQPAPRDKFGDPVPGGAATETVSSGWLVAPGNSTELHDGQNSVDSDVDLYRLGAPGSDVIRPADQVRVRGLLYEVVGEPAVWRLGTVVRLRNFAG
jgi:hypothetical protein